MKQIALTDAQAKALMQALDALRRNAPGGARAILDSDILRTVYLQLARQKTK